MAAEKAGLSQHINAASSHTPSPTQHNNPHPLSSVTILLSAPMMASPHMQCKCVDFNKPCTNCNAGPICLVIETCSDASAVCRPLGSLDQSVELDSHSYLLYLPIVYTVCCSLSNMHIIFCDMDEAFLLSFFIASFCSWRSTLTCLKRNGHEPFWIFRKPKESNIRFLFVVNVSR